MAVKLSDIPREVIAGLATFSTLSYIIFVQPVIMSQAGADFETVLFATCISSAVATAFIGLIANVPFAIAPAMGHNVFFVLALSRELGLLWEEALFVNFISASISLILSLTGVAPKVVEAIPKSLKSAIPAGIGFLIAFVGLQWAGVVKDDPAVLVSIGDFSKLPTLAFLSGFLTSAVLWALRVRFAIIFGIAVSTAFLIFTGNLSLPEKFISPALPEKIPQFEITLDLDWSKILHALFVLLILDVFDTAGTLVGLFEVAKIPYDKDRMKKCFVADSAGAVLGTVLGTSTLTTYVESAVGIQAGGRTRITAFTVALLFLVSAFLVPLAKLVGGGINFEGTFYYPQIAVAMVFVGFFMFEPLFEINWKDATESIPAFATVVVMGLTLSITDGIAVGFILYTLLKILSGKLKDVSLLTVLISTLFLAKFVFLG